MAARSTFSRPAHIGESAWALACRMSLKQLAGQLTSIDPGRYMGLTGETRACRPAARSAALASSASACASCRRSRSGTAIHPFFLKDDGRRGFYLVAPFPLYCFDLDLVRRAHEQAAADAHRAGVTLIRLTCDYAFSQNQGRTQEGGIVSDPVFISDVTRASTEGLLASGRIAVVLKHFGPYQYTAGPDYTSLPIEKTEFLETVLPALLRRLRGRRPRGDDELRHAQRRPRPRGPLPSRPRQGARRPGRHYRIRLRWHLRALRRLRLCREPKEAALRAFTEGGIHIDLCSLLFLQYLPELVEEGRIEEADLVVRAAEMLQVKEEVGILDDPWPGTAPDREQQLPRRPDHRLRGSRPRLGRPPSPEAARSRDPADRTDPRGPARRPRPPRPSGSGRLARRLLQPRQPSPRARGHPARRNPAPLAGSGLRPRLRLCLDEGRPLRRLPRAARGAQGRARRDPRHPLPRRAA